MYSGRRRPMDIQMFIDWFSAGREYDDVVVSLDIAVSDKCDLSTDSAFKFWCGIIMSKRVLGIAGGPPCETWSAARFVPADPVEPGKSPPRMPPPLRSREEPWGVQGLELKHYRQLELASRLLRVFLLFVVLVLRRGGAALLEHPSRSKHILKAPSIWLLPYLKWLLHFKSARFIDFVQSVHGQKSVKPTTFYICRLPLLPKIIHSADPAVKVANRPLETLIGRDSNGQWRTAGAKEYPPSLCAVIARSFIHAFDAAFDPNGNHADPIDLSEFVSHFDVYSEVQSMGADCMLHNASMNV